MPEAIDTVWRLGASGKRECYLIRHTDNEFPSPHVRPCLINDRVAKHERGQRHLFSINFITH